MPITAETFDVEHFESLRRGLDAAEGAFRLREEEIEKILGERDAQKLDLDEKIADLTAEVTEMKEQVAAWDRVIELILDVDRGVRDFPELIAWLKAEEHIDPR